MFVCFFFRLICWFYFIFNTLHILCIHTIGTVQPDYGFENENLVFDHDDAKQCIRIPIIDDDQVEDLEMFFVNLTTSDAGIETSQEARIYIDDPTDSKYKLAT